ncbi:MAG: hypothetical protein ACYSUM_14870 [Planctomycetota bacterium]|jgi:hypothetical protein
MRRVLVICTALAAGAQAQPMDELPQKLLDGWEKVAYQLGRAGVKTCWFEIQAKITGMTGTMATRGTYYWDGTRGKLKWDRPAVGTQLALQGWTAARFDEEMVPDFRRKALAGCKLTAKREGKTTVVTVAGKNAPAWRRFVFDKDGLLQQILIDGPTPQGRIKKCITYVWKKVGTRYVAHEWTFEMKMAMSVLKGKGDATYAKAGKYHVLTRYREKVTHKGKPWSSVDIVFSSHQLK